MSILNLPGYEQATPYTGEFETLPSGGYVCKIVGVKIEDYNKGGRQFQMLALALDIHEGDKKGFYQRQYDADTSMNKKWRGTYRQMIPKGDKSEADNKALNWFKGLITSIEKSNDGFIWNKNTDTLKDKLIGCLFGREEFFNTSNGKNQWATKCVSIRTVNNIREGNFTMPPDKPLSGSSASSNHVPEGFTPVITEDDLPF